MRKFAMIVLASLILAGSGAYAIYVLPERLEYWKAAKADYTVAAERVAAIVPRGPQVLDFSDLDHLSDLPPEIATKPDLMHVNLSNTDITDLEPLAALQNLEYLSMNNVPVSNLKPLSNLRGLRNLSVSRTWVFDLAPLAGLSQLQQLNLSYTSIKSLEPILQLRQLQQLTLYNSHAHDGSNGHYGTLARNLPRVNNGTAYEQNYRPGLLYRINVGFGRFRQSWGI